MELLDNMVEILGEETVNRQDFRQLLETGLNQAKVALIPPSMDRGTWWEIWREPG